MRVDRQTLLGAECDGFLVEFEIDVPEGTPESEVTAREDAEGVAAAELVEQGHLVRVWQRRSPPGRAGRSAVIGRRRAGSTRVPSSPRTSAEHGLPARGDPRPTAGAR